MRVGERAKVLRVVRPVPNESVGDREAYVGQTGLVMRRLNVAWETEHGENWELRFDDGSVLVYSTSELAVVHADGTEESLDGEIAAMAEAWGKAPRTPSLPFKRFGAGVSAGPAVLALLVFALAGVLLLWAGVASGNTALSAGGVLLVIIGIAAAGVLIS
jgi:hypothetical protein